MDVNGFVVDFGKLKPLKKKLDEWDHSLVLASDDPFLDLLNGLAMNGICKIVIAPYGTSSEGIAKHWKEQGNEIISKLTKGRAEVKRVVVYEDWKNKAYYE